MENVNDPFNPNELGNTNDFGKKIVDALIYFFQMLCFILFACPFAFWSGAAKRLAKEREEGSLFKFNEVSPWPFFTFCKKIFFEYFIDGTIFISYFVGTLIAFYCFFDIVGDGFKPAITSFFVTLLFTYYFPMALSWLRDLVYISILLPIRKLLNWLSKPAQYFDLNVKKREL